MGIFDWLKKLVNPEAPDALETPLPEAEVKGRVDVRLLPKEKPKNWWQPAKRVMDRDEAQRLFSASMRTSKLGRRRLLSDRKLLQSLGLPIWEDEATLAKWFGIPVSQLQYFACHRFDDKVCHYIQYAIPKRSGGHRIIMAPKRRLKRLQRKLLVEMASLPVHEAAHGFVKGRSVKTNATPHVGKKVVIKMDLQDFFGTVTFGRVRGLLIKYGYSFPVATSLALLMTEAQRQKVVVDGVVNYTPVGNRTCPQGAPTSPLICNAIAKCMDARLNGLAKSVGFTYTRYADDMAFSGDNVEAVGQLLANIRRIVDQEGFVVNESKTRVMRAGQSQKVTGVTVNETMGLSRKERRQIRARIHSYNQNPNPAELEKIAGLLAYLGELNRPQADALRAQLEVK